MLLAPRPPLSRTKAVCSPPAPPSTSCALTTTDTGHKSGLNYVRHRETVQQRNPFFFFSSFLHWSALFSGETPVILPVMTPVEDREHYLHFGAGEKPQSGGVERRRKKAHTSQPARLLPSAALIGNLFWDSLFTIFFFSQA